MRILEHGRAVGDLDTETCEVSKITSPKLAALIRKLKASGIYAISGTGETKTAIGDGVVMRKVGPGTAGILIPEINRNGFICER